MISSFVQMADSEAVESPAGSIGFDEMLTLLNRYREEEREMVDNYAPTGDENDPHGDGGNGGNDGNTFENHGNKFELKTRVNVTHALDSNPNPYLA